MELPEILHARTLARRHVLAASWRCPASQFAPAAAQLPNWPTARLAYSGLGFPVPISNQPEKKNYLVRGTSTSGATTGNTGKTNSSFVSGWKNLIVAVESRFVFA
jgi:hypothetical protein